jgi:hypothetical protein
LDPKRGRQKIFEKRGKNYGVATLAKLDVVLSGRLVAVLHGAWSSFT